MSRVMAIFGNATAIGPVVGGWLAPSFGWPWIFLILAVFAWVVAVLVLLLLTESRPIEPRSPLRAGALLQDQ